MSLPRTEQRDVAPLVSVDGVVSVAADEDVGALAAGDRVVAVAAVDGELLEHGRWECGRVDGVVPAERVDGQRVVGGLRIRDVHGLRETGDARRTVRSGDGDLIVAVGAVDGHLIRLAVVRAEVEVQRVECGPGHVADGDRVGAAECVEVDPLDSIGVHRDVRDVADELEPVAGRRQRDVLGHVGAVEDHRVAATPALDGVAAFTGVPDERVVAASEVDRVVSATRVDRVVPGVAANRLGSRASDEVVVSAAALDRRRDGVGEDAVGLVDADVVVAGAGVDVDAGHVRAREGEDGRAVVEVDLQDARIAGLQAERDRVAVRCALDRQGAVFQLGLLEAVCCGVALHSDEPGQAREGGRGRRQSSQMVHVFLLSNVCSDGRGSDPSLAPWATPCLFGAAANTGGSPRCERPPRRRTMGAMIDPRLRQLYNPQLADRNRLEARAARRVALGARRRYELELQRRPSLDDVRRPRAERRPRLAVAAVTVIAAVVVIAVVLAASGGAL